MLRKVYLSVRHAKTPISAAFAKITAKKKPADDRYCGLSVFLGSISVKTILTDTADGGIMRMCK